MENGNIVNGKRMTKNNDSVVNTVDGSISPPSAINTMNVTNAAINGIDIIVKYDNVYYIIPFIRSIGKYEEFIIATNSMLCGI